jgi:cytochrome c biogenesis protein CcmG, thiol:disulfide interchange protein DsbE
MKRTIGWIVVLATTLTAAVTASGQGTQAPDVTLTVDGGPNIRLSELKGKVVLMDFWASWCIPCRASFPAMNTLQKELREKGLAVVAVNVDEQRRDADRFLAERPHTMAVAFDPQGKAAEAFNLKGMPSTVLVDRHGEIRFTHMGYTEKTLAQFRSEILLLLGES